MPGVIRVVASSPPYSGPPPADLDGRLSTAYWIALRTSGLASAGRFVFIARYCSAPDFDVADPGLDGRRCR